MKKKKKMRKKEKSWTTTTTRKDEDEGHEWNEMKSKTKWMNIEGMNRTEENRTKQYVCLFVWICKLKEPLKWMDKCTNVCLSWTPVHGSNDVVWAKQIIYSFFHSVVVFHVFHSWNLCLLSIRRNEKKQIFKIEVHNFSISKRCSWSSV